ncbi:MAG: SRPBCC domain-containing protein [Alphaproteobacteria bacterium]
MTAAARAAKPIAESEVLLSRMFDAPRALVFRTWTDPHHLAQWWGPRGFTNPVCELDLRVGGRILIHMCAPDGTVYPMTGTFCEIVAPERLVFTAIAEDVRGRALLEGLVTVTFEDRDGKTKVTVREKAVALVPVAGPMLAGMENGWAQSLTRLDVLVAKA